MIRYVNHQGLTIHTRLKNKSGRLRNDNNYTEYINPCYNGQDGTPLVVCQNIIIIQKIDSTVDHVTATAPVTVTSP